MRIELDHASIGAPSEGHPNKCLRAFEVKVGPDMSGASVCEYIRHAIAENLDVHEGDIATLRAPVDVKEAALRRVAATHGWEVIESMDN